jgi:hypothetical protein
MKPIAVQDSDVHAAFAALVEVAATFAAQGRQCFAATAKPALRVRLEGFDETRLGFATFREFLVAAQRQGFVKLAFVGQDYQILPAGGAPTPLRVPKAREAIARPTRRKIKKAFWNAAVDLRSAESWFYDPETRLVVGDPGEGGRGQLVRIPRADAGTQEGWIEEFITGLDGDAEKDLVERVHAAETLPDKLRAVSSRPDTRAAWYDHRTRRVTEMLESWKHDHGLSGVDLFEYERAPRRPATPRPRADRQSKDDALRARLHRAIDQMPISELLRLSVPIEYIVDR